jgi:nitrate/TMAO reductase-like tetraheme cytochrome c subunit
VSNERNDRGEPTRLWNWLSFAGLFLILVSLLAGVLFFLLELVLKQPAPYAGILYLVLTGLIVAGFILVPVGMMRRGAGGGRLTDLARRLSELRLDLEIREHRYAVLTVLSLGIIVLLGVGIGMYKSYHATESTAFCGQLCHGVMNPEWVRYQDSAHARVSCTECHIGSGAGWYVRSKLSGLRQVWATLIGSYPRPIPTPIHDLRPARETCEECHWRRKFIGYKESVSFHYLGDEENTLHQLRMLVKIGGEKTSLLRGSGIHYHMLIASSVEYVATDSRRQEIAWVRVNRADGSVSEYERNGNGLSEEERAKLEVRRMDCMDCHNRPAHQFPSPIESINRALEDGRLAQELPFIKVQAVLALNSAYPSTEEAMVGIANELREFYRNEYPFVLEKQSETLTLAIREVQRIYRETIFPEMDAKWLAYPNNIGHRNSPGCFRCHTDEMVSKTGETIFTTCNKCHIILAQGSDIERVNVNLENGLAFLHPGDFEEIDEYTECIDCHTGGGEVYE